MHTARVDTILQGYRMETRQGDFAFCGVNLIEAPDGAGGTRRIVVDTGHFGRGDALRDALAARGLTASDIDTVVLTHTHWDHVQNVQQFDRAVFLTHPRELDYIANPHPGDSATPTWTKAVLDRFDIRSVTEGSELAPGVHVVEVPGHSPGTIAVAVQTAGGLAVVTGDAIQNALVAQQRRNALVFWSEVQANASVSRLVEMADVIHPGHDQAFRIDAENRVTYTAEFDLVLTLVAPHDVEVPIERLREFAPRIHEAPPGWMA